MLERGDRYEGVANASAVRCPHTCSRHMAFGNIVGKSVRRGLAAAFAFAALVLCGCGQQQELNERTVYALGTVCTISIYGEEALADEAEQLLYAIDQEMSWRRAGSDISKINEGSGGFVEVSEDTFRVIARALEIGKASGGALDITAGVLTREWNISEDPHVPDRETIERGLELIDYSRVELDEETCSVKIGEGQFLDVGAVAKGYAADRLTLLFREGGVKSGLINLGGNVCVIGKRPDGRGYRTGIRDPEKGEGENFAVMTVKSDKTIVVSGAYERQFTENGVTYHHILDPKTGYPAESDVLSSVIVADSSMTADALSTAVFVMGADKGLALAEQTEGAEALVVTKSGTLRHTDGLYSECSIELVKGCRYVEEG